MNSEMLRVFSLMFFLFCVAGWIWESIYMSVIEKRIQNRGFLHGPYIPIYGCAGLIVHFTLGRLQGEFFSINTLLIYVIGMFCATLLELITATLAEKILGYPLWDYTIYKLNYKGKISLITSLFWGVVAVTFVQILNPMILRLFSGFTKEASIIIITIMATLMGTDLLLTSIFHSPLPDWGKERYDVVNGRWEELLNKVDRKNA